MSALFEVAGEVGLVTGASSGFGAHFSRVLVEHGAQVVLAARRLDKVQALAEALGSQALGVALDVRDRDSIRAAFDQAEAAFGTVSVLVNNAGVADTQLFTDMSEESWDFVLDTNLSGVYRVGQEAAQRMIAQGVQGSIINIASVLGFGVQTRQTSYAVSKAGVVQLTRSMALELSRHSIRVNALAPGYFITEINEAFLTSERGQAYVKMLLPRRKGEMDEISGPLLLLASKASTYMTGVTIPIDGGTMLRGL